MYIQYDHSDKERSIEMVAEGHKGKGNNQTLAYTLSIINEF